MADEDLSLDDVDEESTGNDEDGKSTGSKKKLIIIISAVSLLLVLGGVAAYFLIFSEQEKSAELITEVEMTEDGDVNSSPDPEESIEKEVAKKPPQGEAIYISVPEPFLVNIKSGKRSRMMQIKIQLLVRSKEAEDQVKQHMPLIRNDLLDFFSLADAKEVRTREGRNALKKGALSTVQEVMTQQVGVEAIEMVLFTGFVIQ